MPFVIFQAVQAYWTGEDFRDVWFNIMFRPVIAARADAIVIAIIIGLIVLKAQKYFEFCIIMIIFERLSTKLVRKLSRNFPKIVF